MKGTKLGNKVPFSNTFLLALNALLRLTFIATIKYPRWLWVKCSLEIFSFDFFLQCWWKFNVATIRLRIVKQTVTGTWYRKINFKMPFIEINIFLALLRVLSVNFTSPRVCFSILWRCIFTRMWGNINSISCLTKLLCILELFVVTSCNTIFWENWTSIITIIVLKCVVVF